jgi:carbonic anhydrase
VQKLVRGIIEFRKNVRPSYRETFARLALEQSPDCLFIACSDSRVVPNLFASTEPGDLFVIRNVGNLVAPCDHDGRSLADRSEGAAVEFACLVLGVRDIVVCGHSECGAMRALLQGVTVDAPNLKDWLDVGKLTLPRLEARSNVGVGLPDHNRLSQLNVLQQIEHLKTYPAVRERFDAGLLTIHGWWFDLKNAEVLAYDPAEGRFLPIAEDDELVTDEVEIEAHKP